MLDGDLLKQFASTGSQEAFAEIVRRHMDAVYAAARRQVREGQLAEDVAQAVFIIHARKAAKLQNRDSLAGWLIKTTNLASRDALKMESRRRRHEQHAASLAQTHVEQSMMPQLEAISPELDRALSNLSESDRSAVTLRYLEGKSALETATLLGISEQAATKRVFRAVGRLRKILLRKSIITPAISLAVVLEQIPRVSAPVALAGNVAAAAGTATPTTLAIAKGVIYMMTWHKFVATLILIAALAAATGVGIITTRLIADDTAVPAPQPPAPMPADQHASTSVASLSNGASIEVVGLNENPSNGKPCWAVNGDPAINNRPSRRLNLVVRDGDLTRQIVVKTSRSVTGSLDPASINWSIIGNSGTMSSGDSDNTAFGIHDNPDGVTLHATIAAGPWVTVCHAQGGGQMAEGGILGSFLFSGVFNQNGETHILAGYYGLANQDVRLVAVDKTGKLRPAETATSIGDAVETIGDFSVNLPRNSIREWQLQTRSFNQWIEIRHISLHRGQKTDVQVVTSDDKPK